jgi:hypothetical protein
MAGWAQYLKKWHELFVYVRVLLPVAARHEIHEITPKPRIITRQTVSLTLQSRPVKSNSSEPHPGVTNIPEVRVCTEAFDYMF